MVGLIYIDMKDEYHKIIKMLTGHKHSIIGIYSNNKYHLFNVHNGMPSIFFDNNIDKENLEKNYYIESIEYNDIKSNIIKSSLDSILKRNFENIIYDNINDTPRYEQLFESYFEKKSIDSEYITGYSIVNKFFLEFFGIKSSFSDVENKYLNKIPELYDPICVNNINNETNEHFEILKSKLLNFSSILVNYTLNNKNILNFLEQLHHNSIVINDKKINNLKLYLEEFIDNVNISTTCNISSLIESFNELSNEYGLEIKIVGNVPKRVNLTNIKYINSYSEKSPLKCISSKSSITDIKKFDLSELKSLLVYIDSLRSDSGVEQQKYSNLKNKIVNEISKKSY